MQTASLQGENCRLLEKEAPEKLSMIGVRGLEHLEGLHDQILQELDHRTESPSSLFAADLGSLCVMYVLRVDSI